MQTGLGSGEPHGEGATLRPLPSGGDGRRSAAGLQRVGTLRIHSSPTTLLKSPVRSRQEKGSCLCHNKGILAQ